MVMSDEERRRKRAEYMRRYRATHPLTPERRAANVEHTRKWRAAHPDRHRAAVYRWRQENPGVDAARTRLAKLANVNTRYRFASNAAKRRATSKGLPFEDVDLEALAVRDGWHCWICLGPVDRAIMDRHNPWNMSIDHVIPESEGGGWTWDNLRLAHYGCNILRGTSSMEDARRFAHEFLRLLAAQGCSRPASAAGVT